jgi:tetratricopeptide (TPR) repeat protein
MAVGAAERVGLLLPRGQEALVAGDLDAALAHFGEAAGLTRQLVAEHPGESSWLSNLGVVLYSLAGALNGVGRFAESVQVLTEAEDAYQKSAPPAQQDLLVADVRLRRAAALAEQGAGVSAVIDAQAAVLAYIGRARHDSVDEAYLGLARSLMMASDVFGAFADPAMALEAARQGLSWIVEAVNSGQVDVRDHAYAVIQAASVELTLLDALGRSEERASAAGLLQWLAAQAVPTLTQRKLGNAGLSAASGGVDAAVRSLLLVTGSDYGLEELLIRNPVGPLCAPVLRVPPEKLIMAAGGAAEAASLLLGRGVAAGLRLGLEAHFLMAYALEQSLRHHGAGPPAEADRMLVRWCRLLATIAARLEADGDVPLARDVAHWGTKMFLLIDPDHDAPEDNATLAEATAVFARLGSP